MKVAGGQEAEKLLTSPGRGEGLFGFWDRNKQVVPLALQAFLQGPGHPVHHRRVEAATARL